MAAPAGTLFVLTKVEDRREVPVAVTDNEAKADQWVRADEKHNWLPFTLNDFSGLSSSFTSFQPREQSVTDMEMKNREEQQKELQRLQGYINRLLEINEKQRKLLQRGVRSSLLKSAARLAMEKRSRD